MRRLLLVAAFFISCGPSSEGENRYGQPSPERLFSPSITRVTFEVAYAQGAEPYTGSFGTSGDVWGLFEANALRVFQKSPKTLMVPTMLEEMVPIDETRTSFTANDILGVADQHRSVPNTATAASFYVLFLAGDFIENGTVMKDVLGVSLGQSGVIAMFKPVISQAGGSLDAGKYIEQTTLVHEFGHAIGLVNNGIPLKSQHQDPAHGNHCTNPQCAMYWEKEGASAAAKFLKELVYTTLDQDVFYGPECLGDVDAMSVGQLQATQSAPVSAVAR